MELFHGATAWQKGIGNCVIYRGAGRAVKMRLGLEQRNPPPGEKATPNPRRQRVARVWTAQSSYFTTKAASLPRQGSLLALFHSKPHYCGLG
ncbi:hypothetical protein MAIT1_02920 [Magnetofaba australis IT-1]|uniref:Uncharacterized protein n=1 Tax=Magnetofaba australis IT-1 TaxID=1434232 RepID=A0A1Y2K558_9PROT|nr:hypothetical protein MAIT1_02920 [Magnetofaba australis IT-1]